MYYSTLITTICVISAPSTMLMFEKVDEGRNEQWLSTVMKGMISVASNPLSSLLLLIYSLSSSSCARHGPGEFNSE